MKFRTLADRLSSTFGCRSQENLAAQAARYACVTSRTQPQAAIHDGMAAGGD
ncbi:MAG TPA: hypothetical protein VF831_01235 [Anaerolineales bacterium]